MKRQRLNNLLQSHTETGVQSEIKSRSLKLQSSVLITKFFFSLIKTGNENTSMSLFCNITYWHKHLKKTYIVLIQLSQPHEYFDETKDVHVILEEAYHETPGPYGPE